MDTNSLEIKARAKVVLDRLEKTQKRMHPVRTTVLIYVFSYYSIVSLYNVFMLSDMFNLSNLRNLTKNFSMMLFTFKFYFQSMIQINIFLGRDSTKGEVEICELCSWNDRGIR